MCVYVQLYTDLTLIINSNTYIITYDIIDKSFATYFSPMTTQLWPDKNHHSQAVTVTLRFTLETDVDGSGLRQLNESLQKDVERWRAPPGLGMRDEGWGMAETWGIFSQQDESVLLV